MNIHAMQEFIFRVVPMLILVGFTLTMVYLFIRQENRRRQQELKLKHSSELVRLRFQAYERLILLIERLNPEALVLREQRHTMNAFQFQSHLLKIIRKEFEHNISMQLYVSSDVWQKIKAAREGLLRLINTTASETSSKAPALELGRKIIEQSGNDLNLYFNDAINEIKKEMREYYG
ncbi:hypothetical protein QA597_08200 [Marinilabiliaceae bacterium ANBcel2]|nr:hypothetical protein [Marinilabiliaceae bacterium ANBcel2]